MQYQQNQDLIPTFDLPSPTEDLERHTMPSFHVKAPGGRFSLLKTEPAANASQFDMSILSDFSTEPEVSANLMLTMTRSIKSSFVDSHLILGLTPVQKELLELYNITLKSAMGFKQTSSGADYIIQTAVRLPHTFLQGLKLNLFFTDSQNTDVEKHWFSSHDLQDKETAAERLYSLIFYTMLTQYPKLIGSWMEYSILAGIRGKKKDERIEDMKRAFMALFLNKPYPSPKTDVTKLKQLLISFCSFGFTLEWFKEHRKYLNREYKVRFSGEFKEEVEFKFSSWLDIFSLIRS